MCTGGMKSRPKPWEHQFVGAGNLGWLTRARAFTPGAKPCNLMGRVKAIGE
jgi:hypothetical protein